MFHTASFYRWKKNHLKTNQCLNYIFCHIWLLKVELLTADQPVTVRRTNPLTAVITLIAAPLIAL